MALDHRLEGVEARQILVVVVRAQQLVEFPDLLQCFGLQFHAVVVQKLVEARQRGRNTLAAEQRKVRTRGLEVRHEVAAGGTARTRG